MAGVSCKRDFEGGEDAEKGDFVGVKHMTDVGLQRLPTKYVLPVTERPILKPVAVIQERHLPVIDISGLGGERHSEVVAAIGQACQEAGFFQVVNHGVPVSMIRDIMRVASEFFELPLEERKTYMSDDMTKPVRYGTSFNRLKDQVFCWRDFLKLYCHPTQKWVHLWPSNPPDYRKVALDYSEEMRSMAERLMSAIIESLGLPQTYVEKICKDGSQVMVVNFYPACPEPELTFGMPPHTDYGCMTILQQDSVGGLQVLRNGEWEAVHPVPDSFIINIGDHLEVLSNGKYKSIMHRAVVNSERSRVSVATLLSMPFESNIGPAPELIDEDHPPHYRETNFSHFIDLISTKTFKARALLDSLKLA
ncbi:hypothetical protein SUGI_0807650 [Cryptomeria japonica]|uniref:probable 2-oxoglutarate-dependent dioxygenase SLC1 n=1 Tax=Cryptomeria japonica TaxID=3369 RepID=UPI002414CFFE|nr:probable 2-oxoglutarate-dependent dioxygenase SLC1 [Cryptomeria japonica]GLJ39522.1 hypothetical protein SUGI_0807650 [Cryptomeria japonica]